MRNRKGDVPFTNLTRRRSPEFAVFQVPFEDMNTNVSSYE